MKLASAAQMKRADDYAIHNLGVPSLLLMEKAGAAVARETLSLLNGGAGKRIAVWCGAGNNGGDGAAAARLLLQSGAEVRAFLAGDRAKMTPDLLEMERLLRFAGGVLEDYDPADEEAARWRRSADACVDALLGIGLRDAVRGRYRDAIAEINASGVPAVAADIASGVSADTGEVPGEAVKCVKTVTFTLAKPGHFSTPGCLCRGELVIEDIGIPEEAVLREECAVFAVTEADVAPLLPRRKRDTHKGDFGKVLIAGGSVGFTGAPSFAARAAVRTGSGLVWLGVPRSVCAIEAVKNDEAMVFPLPDKKNGDWVPAAAEPLLQKLKGCHVCLIGPGMGRSPGAAEVVRALVSASRVPLVIDADGINALAEHIDIWDKRDCPVILTPHDGEFRRLGGDPGSDRISAARKFAAAHDCVLVLKGHRTVTALPDGRVYLNTTGNPGMAKGGSGDVLSGVIASLIGQGLPPEEAAWAGVWLHGRAGDLCAGAKGEYGMTPSDIAEAMALVIKKY